MIERKTTAHDTLTPHHHQRLTLAFSFTQHGTSTTTGTGPPNTQTAGCSDASCSLGGFQEDGAGAGSTNETWRACPMSFQTPCRGSFIKGPRFLTIKVHGTALSRSSRGMVRARPSKPAVFRNRRNSSPNQIHDPRSKDSARTKEQTNRASITNTPPPPENTRRVTRVSQRKPG